MGGDVFPQGTPGIHLPILPIVGPRFAIIYPISTYVFYNYHATRPNHLNLHTIITIWEGNLLILSINHTCNNTTTTRTTRIMFLDPLLLHATQNLLQGYQILSHKYILASSLLRAKSLTPLLKYETTWTNSITKSKYQLKIIETNSSKVLCLDLCSKILNVTLLGSYPSYWNLPKWNHYLPQ